MRGAVGIIYVLDGEEQTGRPDCQGTPGLQRVAATLSTTPGWVESRGGLALDSGDDDSLDEVALGDKKGDHERNDRHERHGHQRPKPDIGVAASHLRFEQTQTQRVGIQYGFIQIDEGTVEAISVEGTVYFLPSRLSTHPLHRVPQGRRRVLVLLLRHERMQGHTEYARAELVGKGQFLAGRLRADKR